MKKKVLIVAGCFLLLVAAGLVLISRNSMNFSKGTCIAADNGSYLMVLGRSPIVMHARTGNGEMFDDLETGDRIFIIHDGIAESYPGKTGVYACIKLGEGHEADIPKDMIGQLKELGWIADESAQEVPESSLLQETAEILTSPPDLWVTCGGRRIQALGGTYSWRHPNEDGTATGIEACGTHPLDSKEYMPDLDISLSLISSIDPFRAYLEFGVTPDEVVIRCWKEECWGYYEAESEDLEVQDAEYDMGDGHMARYITQLKMGNYIYEVTAKWNGGESYGGTAHYSFYTTMGEYEMVPVQTVK